MLGSITRATASEEPMPTVHDQPRGSLAELAGLFLKLGTIGFGGPAAHIAMQRDEVVGRRGWLTEQEFLDLLGATNFIPGPNSTEMAIHIGYRRAGWPGLLVAGICFITPAALIVLALAWLYVSYGQTPTPPRSCTASNRSWSPSSLWPSTSWAGPPSRGSCSWSWGLPCSSSPWPA
jgi:hypothetical protein